MTHSRLTAQGRQRGTTLVELMVAITLGMLIMAALLALYVNITRTNSEMSKSNRQIENGRFAIQVLQNDLVHAGFWAGARPGTPTAIPAPCLDSGSWDDAYKANLLGIPVQGFADGSALGDCGVSGVLSDSDVLVVSHANTCAAGTAGCDGGADTGPHIQVSGCTTVTPPEAMYLIDDDAAKLTLHKKDCAAVAERRKIVTNIYYLASSNGQPTLMRAALINGAFAAPQPLIEGIEAMRFEYGIDNVGKNGAPISATNPGDGKPDAYVSCPAGGCTLDQLANVVAIRIHVLARNLEETKGYTDTKSYQLGETTVSGSGAYKRHVFSTTVRLVNPSGRRETP